MGPLARTAPHPPGQNPYGFDPALCSIPKPDAEAAVRHFSNPVLIWRWPDIAPYTHRALAAFCESPNARKLIYTGEADGGCTGSRELQQILKTRFSYVDSCNIPSFFNCHDRCQLFSW